eukprot:6036555-Prymnesium_polylepis.1
MQRSEGQLKDWSNTIVTAAARSPKPRPPCRPQTSALERIPTHLTPETDDSWRCHFEGVAAPFPSRSVPLFSEEGRE